MSDTRPALIEKTGSEALSAAFFAGFYLAVFYAFNNITLLRQEGIVVLFALAILPLLGLTAVVYGVFRLLGKPAAATAPVIFLLSAFLVFMLHPPLLEIGVVRRFFLAFGSEYILANFTFVCSVSALLTFIFQKRMDLYALLLGCLGITALVMGFYKLATAPSPLERAQGVGVHLHQVVLEQRPNIYFILADGFASFALLRDKGVDVSDFSTFLVERDFRLYEDTYSNYQPTTSAMPAMLNMEHHYYTLNEGRVHFSEVSRAARRVIGGDNNVSHILRNNGYSIQYVHGGTYLLLQGCSADSCFPEVDRLVGVKIILSHIFKSDLLSADDKVSRYLSLEEVRAESLRQARDPGRTPHFQYIHVYTPNHSPNSVAGRCDEALELANYTQRLESASTYMKQQISDLLEGDPDAVIVLAGDHGPFLSNRCAPLGLLDGVEEYRDRAGILTAIRWPRNYSGKYDDQVVSGVNLFRFLLASLAIDPTPLLETTASDDVFIRDGSGRPYIVLHGGEPMPEPKPIQVRARTSPP